MTQGSAETRATAGERRARLLAAVRARRSGVTIYGLARALQRPYRRVFDAVKRLAAEGALRVEPVARNNRRATLVTAPGVPGVAVRALPVHLSEAERAALAALATRLAAFDPRVASLILFGSRARGDSGPESDLDLAVRVRGRRNARLEQRIVRAVADVEWSTPLEGALRLSPLVRFAGERRAALDAALDREGIPVWKRHG